MIVANCDGGFDILERKAGFMKTLVSLALGAVMLFGGAALGLHSGSASARSHHDRNWYAHHHHHHHHHHYRHNRLSY